MATFTRETTAEEVASFCSASIRHSVVLITGASPGSLGAEFVTTIAKHGPSLIILAGRNEDKAKQTARRIAETAPNVPTRTLALDLASQQQIRAAAEEVLGYTDVQKIDVLVNSAGVMAQNLGRTVEGVETHFGINHIGHFLFTNLITKKLIRHDGQAASRIVNVSSTGYELSPIRFEDWNFDKSLLQGSSTAYNPWLAYGQSKTANMLFTLCIATDLQDAGILSVSLSPGPTKTGLSAHLSKDDWVELAKIGHNQGNHKFYSGLAYKTIAQATADYVFAAFHPSMSHPDNRGAHVQDCQVVESSKLRCWGRDLAEARELWALSESIVKQKFDQAPKV